MSIDSLASYVRFNEPLFPELSPELGGLIISSYLGDVTLLEMASVCTRWRSIIERVTWNQLLVERGFDPATVSYGEYVRDLNRLKFQLFPSMVVSGANVFEVQEKAAACDVEALRTALIEAAYAGDFTKVVMLLDMGATSSVAVCKEALQIDRPNKISAEIFVRLVKDVSPNIEILNAAWYGCKPTFIKPALLAWKCPTFTAIDSHWESILEDALKAEDVDYAYMLLNMGVKIKKVPVEMLTAFIRKIPQREMTSSIKLFELTFACGVMPEVINLVEILKLPSLSIEETTLLMEAFLKAGKFSSDALMKHFLFTSKLLNSKCVNEVLKLLNLYNVRPSAEFFEFGLRMNVLSIDSIQLCLNSGLTLSKENLDSLSFVLADPSEPTDSEALAKLQLFATFGIAFDNDVLFTFLKDNVPTEIVQFICNQGITPSHYAISLAIRDLPLEYLKILIEAGGAIDPGVIRDAERFPEKAEYLKSIMVS